MAGADSKLRSGQISKKSTHLIKKLCEVAVGKKNSFEIYGNDYNTHDGTAIRDYIHVSDLADIHIEVSKYLMNKSESNLFNCGYGKGYSVLDVVKTTNELTNNSINYNFTRRRDGDVEKLTAQTSKFKNFIKWKPKNNNLKKIIQSSLDWEKKLYEKDL